MAGMIIEEPPNNASELFELIGEYLLDSRKI